MSNRYVIYARYSTNLQNERSIEDQVNLCRSNINDGDEIVKLYTDRAMSGTLMHKRVELLSLLNDAENNYFDVVLSESLDRLSRDMENIAHIYKICTFFGVRIRTIHEGEISAFHVGISGAMSTINMNQMKARILRGQRGNVQAGKNAGGLSYGYKVRPYNNQGVLERGFRQICPEEAKIVRNIYKEFAKGATASSIARNLNIKGVKGPRGNEWASQTLIGNRKLNGGIILNPVYKGELIWGKTAVQWHPITNKKIIIVNPSEEWVIHRDEQLRIVPDDLWNACQNLRSKNYNAGVAVKARKKKRILLFCGRCKRKMRQTGQKYFICVNYENKRNCIQIKSINITKLLILISKFITEPNEQSDDAHIKLEEKAKFFNANLSDLSLILQDASTNTEISLGSTESEFIVKQKKFKSLEEKINSIQSKHMEQMNLHITDLLKEPALLDRYFSSKAANTDQAFFENIITKITVHHEGKDMFYDVKWDCSAIQKICSEHLQDRKYSA